MTNNVKELLPIGSVVRLKGAKKDLMIFGVCQTELKNKKTYDYVGVIWPEGNMGQNTQLMFNHSNIETVKFTGLDTQERQEFMERLSGFYETKE